MAIESIHYQFRKLIKTNVVFSTENSFLNCIIVKSVIAGEVSCSENTLNFIVSKVAGWNSVNNQSKGEPQGEKVGVNITDSEITFNAPKLTINTPITITGDVRVNGNITASGIIQGNTP